MQTFSQKKIALAVGTALVVMAGAAQAAAPVYQGALPVFASVGVGADGDALHAAAGVPGGGGVSVKLNMLIGTANAGLSDAKFYVNSGTVGSTAAAAEDDVFITANGIMIPLAELGGGGVSIQPVKTSTGEDVGAAVSVTQGGTEIAYVNGAGALPVVADTHYKLIFTLTPANGKSIRINKATGALEYSWDKGVTFFPVVATLTKGASAISDQTAVTAVPLAVSLAATATKTGLSLAPTPTVKTFAVAGADKISGLTVDFNQVVAAPTKTTLQLWDRAAGDVTNIVDVSNAPTTGVTAVTFASAAGSTTSFDVALTDPTKVDWDNSGTIDLADAKLYAPKTFNTGVKGAASPLELKVPGTGPAYANVAVEGTGAAATVKANQTLAAATDGAAPVIVANGITFSTPSAATANAPSKTNIGLTFSEPMSRINGDDLREVLENVLVGTDTLAALSLNSGVAPMLGDIDNTTTIGLSTVFINGVATADVATTSDGSTYIGKSISVSRGITYQEINDTNYTANLAKGTTLDIVLGEGAYGEQLSGGIRSASGAVEAIPATPVAQVAVAPVPSVYWGRDTTALASASSASSPELIDTITVTFAAGKGVKLAPAGTKFGTAPVLLAAKTNADLTANLVVDVRGANGIVFQVKPVSATLDSANVITAKVPTALIYQQLKRLNTHLSAVYISYVADGGNAVNNTLVSTDAASTLLSPIAVVAGTLQNDDTPVTDAGAEPVVLPRVFTAVQTGGQSTLLTQDIQSNIVGATAGSKVTAYLAYWSDVEKTVVEASIVSGKITNSGDKVATDLAIQFADQDDLEDAITEQLQKIAPSAPAKPGISEAVKAVSAASFPVYVKLIRSNDTVASTKGSGLANDTGLTPGVNASQGQNYLEARAILSTTYAGAQAAGGLVHSGDTVDPIYEVMLNPNTGAITGRLTGNITIKQVKDTENARGLRFLDGNGVDSEVGAVAIGSSVLAQKSATGLALPGSANVNLLMGIDPDTADLGAITALNPFVLLVLQDQTGKYTLLTSANPQNANYMPFAPDLLSKLTGTGGIAKRAAALLSVTDVKALDIPKSSNWALYGLGNPALAAKPAVSVKPDSAFARNFVGLNTDTGLPKSFWTNDAQLGDPEDFALTMAGNKIGVATELMTDASERSGPTLITISDSTMVKGAQALAWKNANGESDAEKLGRLFVAQATGPWAPTTAVVPKLAAGWSLVNVPGVVGTPVTSLGTVVDAVIKVGAQVGYTGTTLTEAGDYAGDGTGQFTWLAEDGVMPTLTAGEAVFVHAKAAGNL